MGSSHEWHADVAPGDEQNFWLEVYQDLPRLPKSSLHLGQAAQHSAGRSSSELTRVYGPIFQPRTSSQVPLHAVMATDIQYGNMSCRGNTS